MGHDLPSALYSTIIQAIDRNAKRGPSNAEDWRKPE
jgi:hypothetical protein